MNDAFGYWLSGFIDGEGCFSISKRTNVERYLPRFDLYLRFDDREIIEEIHSTLGMGSVNVRKGRSLSNPCVGWHVSSKKDMLSFCEIVNRFPLRAKKKHDYAIWEQAVREYADPDRSWTRLGNLYTELTTSRKV